MVAGREVGVVRVVGSDGYERLQQTRCLLVGAGGIGSELLKDLILVGFGEVHVVDLDTIDLSNLNRQFLFRQRDIKQPKAATAVKAVEYFSNSTLVAHQGNITDSTKFPLHWFQQFDIIFNALDNLGARRYVNKMALFLQVPLLESGTAGFDGYMQPIIPFQTECFDCTTKETPKTFPVCTIRSTPSQPIHCIVWAKNFLFTELFQHQQSSVDASQDWGTDNPEEIERIEQETSELHDLNKIIISQAYDRVSDILNKLFVQDINKLLKIENLWKTRRKPTPLPQSLLQGPMRPTKDLSLSTVWSIQDQVARFAAVCRKLMQRLPNESHSIEFDKDDPDTLEFVATAANIRSYVFGIPLKSVFDIKQTAGNIIPAIATTNAIIAGLSSLVSLRVLNLLKYAPVKHATDINMAFTARASNMSTDRYLSNPKLAPPNCKCSACTRIVRGVVTLPKSHLQNWKLSDLIESIRTKYSFPEDLSVLDTKDQRLLADYDFDDLLDKCLQDLKLSDGSTLLFTDEEEAETIKKPLELYIVITDGKDMVLPELEVPRIPLPAVSKQEKEEEEKYGTAENDAPVVIDEDVSTSKHQLDDEEDGDHISKKTKLQNNQSDLEEIITLD